MKIKEIIIKVAYDVSTNIANDVQVAFNEAEWTDEEVYNLFKNFISHYENLDIECETIVGDIYENR